MYVVHTSTWILVVLLFVFVKGQQELLFQVPNFEGTSYAPKAFIILFFPIAPHFLTSTDKGQLKEQYIDRRHGGRWCNRSFKLALYPQLFRIPWLCLLSEKSNNPIWWGLEFRCTSSSQVERCLYFLKEMYKCADLRAETNIIKTVVYQRI